MNPRSNARNARRALVTLAGALAIGLAPAPALAFEVATGESQLPMAIDASVPDDATLVSTEYARLSTGELVSVADGSPVTDEALLGTADTPPDPLSLTDGERFEQVSVGEARAELAEGGAELLSRQIAGNEYGAYWGTYREEPAFFMSDGTMFVCQAKGVIDVSEHNGTIDWAAAKADGVEGAIIRIGYGSASTQIDKQAARNISECKRLGIPFGVYIYSYADRTEYGREEGAQTVAWLRQLGVSPEDLSYPVYYDLERWSWAGHTPPSGPEVSEPIARAWFDEVQGAGYTNAAVYSYTSYLNTALNSDYIHARTNWVAQYNGTLTYSDLRSTFRGWQYTSSGSVDGISGRVDLNAFGNASWVTEYAVSVASPEGGSLSVSPSSAVAGATVTVRVSPDAGKKLGELTVTGANGAAVSVTGSGSTYSFVMPSSSVTVSASFVCDGGPLCPSSGFADVDQSLWYHSAVDWAIETGLMTGYRDGSGEFGVSGTLSRAQLAQMLWNRAGQPAVDPKEVERFADCSADAFYAQAVAWCAEKGYMTGYDATHFGPEKDMTREELATVLWRMEGRPSTGGDLSSYSDGALVSEFARAAMRWAVSKGAITGQGNSGLLDPQGGLERAQAAMVFMRLYA